MLKVERQALSWQPYCQHAIIQSNPHLNRKQCARRKTGKTEQEQGVREEEMCKKKSPPQLQKQRRQQGHSTITRLKTQKKEKGKVKSEWACRGLVGLSVKGKGQCHTHIHTQIHTPVMPIGESK